MDKNLTYQKARTIRSTKLTDLLADQLAFEPSVGSAIKRTVSLKLQARMKGFKEKFDPLNIIKFMTFGSTLAPALLGRMMGRSSRDIQYFSGRNRPVRVGKSTASKITPIEGGDGDVSGINEQLLKIYGYLKKSNDQEIKRREKENNFKEEIEYEKERRHKEFIDALKKFKGVKQTTATNITKKDEKEEVVVPSFLDTIGNIGEMIKKIVEGMIEAALKPFKWLLKLDWLSKLSGFIPGLLRFLASPLFTLLLGPTLLTIGTVLGLAYALKKLVDLVPDYSKLSAEEAKSILENASSRDIEAFGGREKLMNIAYGDKEYAQSRLDSGEDLTEEEIKLYNERIGMKGPIKERHYVPPRPPEKGQGLNAKNWDRQFSETHNWDGSPKLTEEELQDESQAETSRLARQSRQEVPKSPGGAAIGPRFKAGQLKTKDQRLNDLIIKKAEADLPRIEPDVQTTINNLVQSKSKEKQRLAKLDEIAVHNDEPTFLRMIMASTRLV